jgi:hypothetical protein
MRAATRAIFSGDASEDPPNFWTARPFVPLVIVGAIGSWSDVAVPSGSPSGSAVG